jgi:AcrR family transcriptional regulator
VTLVKPDLAGEDDDGARERMIRAAYELFSQHGVSAIGVERIITAAGVHKTSLYKHFGSKEGLVVAVLARRDEVWTQRWLRAVAQAGDSPVERLLAIFDAFDEWFRRDDFESCLFINTLAESHDRRTPVGKAAAAGLARVRALLLELTDELGVADPEALAVQVQILMSGAIVQAAAGLEDAALLAREVAVSLLEDARRQGQVLGAGGSL